MAHEDDFKPIEDMLSHANPNPDREGCPSAAELEELALRRRDASDPLYVHVSRCSPCYSTIRELQRQHSVSAPSAPNTMWKWWAAAAALLCVLSGAIWYSMQPLSKSVAPIVAQSNMKLPSTVLDLRPFATARSDESPNSSSSLVVSRSRQIVVLVLPVASAEGAYALKLLDSNLAPEMTSSPTAKLVDGVTSISTELDLTRIPAGRYTLALKREPEDWRYFPVQVR
ncbi:MAG: hypothetical protein J0H49_02980 [Acidobacteria bacterium]|nr:hypothetical protein [Acidobacteriota bacterium]